MDVKKYFERIGLEMPETITPDSALLKKLHFAHCTTVPSENVDRIRGIPTSLEEEDMYRKVVEEGRGGICFELNGIFGCLLKALGYKVTDYAARYLRGETTLPMRRKRYIPKRYGKDISRTAQAQHRGQERPSCSSPLFGISLPFQAPYMPEHNQ